MKKLFNFIIACSTLLIVASFSIYHVYGFKFSDQIMVDNQTFTISNDKSKLNFPKVKDLHKQMYWA